MRISDWSSDVCSSDLLDTPEGLYARPGTSYAADFIGAANLVRVLAQQTGDGAVLVDIPGGRISVPGPAPGPETYLAARPEHIGMHGDGQPGRIPAQVEFRRDLGFKATYALRLVEERKSTRLNSSHKSAHGMPFSLRKKK